MKDSKGFICLEKNENKLSKELISNSQFDCGYDALGTKFFGFAINGYELFDKSDDSENVKVKDIEPIEIDELIKMLNRLKEKGANYIQMTYSDGYNISSFKISKE